MNDGGWMMSAAEFRALDYSFVFVSWCVTELVPTLAANSLLETRNSKLALNPSACVAVRASAVPSGSTPKRLLPQKPRRTRRYGSWE